MKKQTEVEFKRIYFLIQSLSASFEKLEKRIEKLEKKKYGKRRINKKKNSDK